MDNFFEILIPLAIAAVYFFGNFFSKKSQEEEETPPSLSRQNDAGDGHDDDVDALERQRRVQEEIRRKIMERRGQSGSAPPQAAPAGPASYGRSREVSAPRETREANKHTREAVHENRHGRSQEWETARDAGYRMTPPAIPKVDSADAYDSGMQAQLQRIEATKRQAEKLQKQVARRRKTTTPEEQSKPRTGGYFTGAVRESLQDPAAARVAFVYGEVLGTPIALRKGPGSVPGLS